MKKLISLLLSAVLAFSLALPALGYRGEALSVFRSDRSYTAGTFSDVAEGAWYAPGVRTVYEKGIMDGSGGKFMPLGQISWAEAAAIAARLCAAVSEEVIPETAGPWYGKYADYASGRGMLPSTCPETAGLGASITRQELAYLFSSVIPEDCLPEINGTTPTDMAQVGAEFREPVLSMYSAGIITGKAGGGFDPSGLATRAEVAAIVTRLLCPARRVGYDPRQSEDMAGQESNQHAGGYAVAMDGVAYYIAYVMENMEDKRFGIYARTGDAGAKLVYEADEPLGRLMADDGALYFIEGSVIKRFNVKTGTAAVVFSSGKGIGCFTVYDGTVYALEGSYSAGYALGSVENGSLKALVSGISFTEAVGIEKSLYAFNGKLYYLLSGSESAALCSAPVKGGAGETLLSGKCIDAVAYDGDTVYYTLIDGDRYDLNVYRASLSLPGLAESYAVLPAEAGASYRRGYFHDGAFAVLTSTARKVWKVGAAGTVTGIYSTGSPYTECVEFTPDGVLEHAIPYLNSLFIEQCRFTPANGAATSYPRYLGLPWFSAGKSAAAPAGGVYTAAPVKKPGGLASTATRAFMTGDGALAVEVTYENGTGGAVEIGAACVDIRQGGERVVSRCIRPLNTIAAGGSAVLTFVFPASSLRSAPDVTAPGFSCAVTGSYNEI